MFFPRAPFGPPHLATWRHCRCLIGPTSSIPTDVSLRERMERLTTQAGSSARAAQPPPCLWLLPWGVTCMFNHRQTMSRKPPAVDPPAATASFSLLLLLPSFFSFPAVKLHFFFCCYSIFCFGGGFWRSGEGPMDCAGISGPSICHIAPSVNSFCKARVHHEDEGRVCCIHQCPRLDKLPWSRPSFVELISWIP